MIPAIALMDGLYGDDQDEFECLTTQPGCKQMCFNSFSPILHHRMWCLSICILFVPTFVFLAWAVAFEVRNIHRYLSCRIDLVLYSPL